MADAITSNMSNPGTLTNGSAAPHTGATDAIPSTNGSAINGTALTSDKAVPASDAAGTHGATGAAAPVTVSNCASV